MNEKNSFIERIKKKSKIDVITKDDVDKIKIQEFIDTGIYSLNALISGSPKKGLPAGKIIQFAGQQGVGKTLLSQEIMINAQKQGYIIIYYDSENAQDLDMLEKRGCDLEKFVYIPIDTVEDLKTSLLNIIEEKQEDEKIMVIIDSIGNLSTKKEIEDTLSNSEKKDMTRASQLKSFFRVITSRAGIKNIPIIIINHVYAAVNNFIPTSIPGGGSGSLYASSVIIELTKAQEKLSNGEVVGAIITAKTIKSRFSKERKKIKINVNFSKGINKYSGLLDLAIETKTLIDLGRGKYQYKDKKISKKDFSPEFFEKLLDEGFAEKLEKEFQYMNVNDLEFNDLIDVSIEEIEE